MSKANIMSSISRKAVFYRISYLAFSSVLRFCIQFAIIILYSHHLSMSVYGQYQFIWMFINFFSLIMLFGLNSLILSTPLYQIKNWIRSHIKLVGACFTFFNAVAIVFLFARGEYFTGEEKALLISLLLLQNVLVIVEAISIKREQEKKVFISNVAYLIVYAGAHLFLFYTQYSATVLLLFLGIASFIKIVILCQNLRLDFSFDTKSEWLGKDWFYLGLNELLGVVVKWIDKWAILFFLPVADFAVYFNATYEIPIFMLILSAIGNISLVELSKFQNRSNRKIKRFFRQSVILMACMVFPSFWFLWFYAGDFIVTIFGDKYDVAIPIFKMSILILPSRIIYSTTILQIYRKTNLIVKGSALDLLMALVFVIILYPIFEMEGLALAFVLSNYVQVGYYLWHTGELLQEKISYFFPIKEIIVIFLISGIIMGISYFFTTSFSIINKIVIGVFCTSGLVTILFLFNYKNINNPMQAIMQSKTKKFKNPFF